MKSRLIPIWSGNRTRASSNIRGRRRRCLSLDQLDDRVLLSSTLVEGFTDSLVSLPGTPSRVADTSAVASASLKLESPGSPMSILGSPSPFGYSPQQVRHAYGFDQIPLDGSGSTIAILDPAHDPTIFSDLGQFDQKFGLTNPPVFSQVNEYGQSFNYPTNQDASLSLETSLDVEWAHAIAPGASILLVEFNATPLGGGSFNTTINDVLSALNTARSYPGVVAVSMSFGGPGLSLPDSSFTTPSGHPGVTFVASSGDSGGPSNPPATSPNVLAVGGTDLPLDSAGDYPGTGSNGEIGWSGSSGGITSNSKPAYQNGVVVQNGSLFITYSVRTTPDVAYNAGDGVAVYDSYASATAPWFDLLGTSAGAPQWAALIALADQGRTMQGLGPLDGPSQTLPLLYHLPNSAFHDITIGGNASHSAGPGYDLATGLGSPIANRVVAGLIQPFTIAAGGSMLFQVDQSGNLWLYNSSGWNPIDSGVVSIGVRPSDGSLFDLHNNGQLFVRNPYNGAFYFIDSGVVSFGIRPSDGSLFDLHSNGQVFVRDPWSGTFYFIDSGVVSIAVVADGTLFDLHNNGQLFVRNPYTGAFYLIDSGVASFDIRPWDGSLFDLHNNGQLFVRNPYNGAFYFIDSGVVSFGIRPSDGSLFDLHSNGQVFVRDPWSGTFYFIDSGVVSIAVVADGTLFDLHSNGQLFIRDPYIGVFHNIDSGVLSFSIRPSDGKLFDLHSNGQLLVRDPWTSVFSIMASGVKSFVLGPGAFTVDVLQSNGTLWQDSAWGWVVLDQNVQSIWLTNGGYTLDALEKTGTLRQFTA